MAAFSLTAVARITAPVPSACCQAQVISKTNITKPEASSRIQIAAE